MSYDNMIHSFFLKKDPRVNYDDNDDRWLYNHDIFTIIKTIFLQIKILV